MVHSGGICIYIYPPMTSRQYFFTIIQWGAIIFEIRIDDTFLKGLMRFSPGVHQIPPIFGIFQQSKLSISHIAGKLCAFWVHTKFWTLKFWKIWCFRPVLCVFWVASSEDSRGEIFKGIENIEELTHILYQIFPWKLVDLECIWKLSSVSQFCGI